MQKDLAIQMNDHLYTKERFEYLHSQRNLDEANKEIKEILENNGSLQEEVRKLRRKKEIESVRLCEVMEEKNKIKEEIEGKNNEIQHVSLQQANFINQLTNENEEITNLRSENERFQNDLKNERQTNERMMKSQESMNRLNEKSQYRYKGKVGLRYT